MKRTEAGHWERSEAHSCPRLWNAVKRTAAGLGGVVGGKLHSVSNVKPYPITSAEGLRLAEVLKDALRVVQPAELLALGNATYIELGVITTHLGNLSQGAANDCSLR